MLQQTDVSASLTLESRELKALLSLLQDHLYWGWIEGAGEFGVEASGRVSPVLREIYRRLKVLAREGEA